MYICIYIYMYIYVLYTYIHTCSCSNIRIYQWSLSGQHLDRTRVFFFSPFIQGPVKKIPSIRLWDYLDTPDNTATLKEYQPHLCPVEQFAIMRVQYHMDPNHIHIYTHVDMWIQILIPTQQFASREAYRMPECQLSIYK